MAAGVAVQLSDEILLAVVTNLGLTSLRSIVSSSKRFWKLGNDDSVWRRLWQAAGFNECDPRVTARCWMQKYRLHHLALHSWTRMKFNSWQFSLSRKDNADKHVWALTTHGSKVYAGTDACTHVLSWELADVLEASNSLPSVAPSRKLSTDASNSLPSLVPSRKLHTELGGIYSIATSASSICVGGMRGLAVFDATSGSHQYSTNFGHATNESLVRTVCHVNEEVWVGGSWEGGLMKWSYADKDSETKVVWNGHEGPVQAIQCNGSLLATGGGPNDETVAGWDLHTQSQLWRVGQLGEGPEFSVQACVDSLLLEDNVLLTSAVGYIKIFDLRCDLQKSGLIGEFRAHDGCSFAMQMDTRQLLSGSCWECDIKIFDIRQNWRIRQRGAIPFSTFSPRENVCALCFTDTTLLAGGTRNSIAVCDFAASLFDSNP